MLTTFVCIFSALYSMVVSDYQYSLEYNFKPGYCDFVGMDIKEAESISAPLGECYNIVCEDAKENDVSIIRCAPYYIGPKSKCYSSEEDLTKPYPLCCPIPICPYRTYMRQLRNTRRVITG